MERDTNTQGLMGSEAAAGTRGTGSVGGVSKELEVLEREVMVREDARPTSRPNGWRVTSKVEKPPPLWRLAGEATRSGDKQTREGGSSRGRKHGEKSAVLQETTKSMMYGVM